MDSYMEKRLTGLHESGVSVNFKKKFTVFLMGLAVVVAFPVVHISSSYYAWASGKAAVNRQTCTCECFDTVFRGSYEWPPSSYKHFYFNATFIMAKIWTITAIFFILLYEAICYLCKLFVKRKLQMSWLVVFLSALYPHYYGWWNYCNYYNEGFYAQWYHQLFFTVTEAMSTGMVLHLCNKDNPPESWKLLFVFTLNLMHIVIGSLDQFVENLLLRRGQVFQAVRDLGLLAPDLLHVFICFFEARLLASRKRIHLWDLFYKEEIALSLIVLILFGLLGKNL